MELDPYEDNVDIDDFIVDLTGVTRESRTMAWVRKEPSEK